MIIEALFGVLVWFFNVMVRIIGVLPLPETPASWTTQMNTAITYLTNGFSYIYAYVEKNIIVFMLSCLIAFMGFILIFKAINFVYEKLTP